MKAIEGKCDGGVNCYAVLATYLGGGGYLTQGTQSVMQNGIYNAPGATSTLGFATTGYGAAKASTEWGLTQILTAIVQQHTKPVASVRFELPAPTVAPNLNGFVELGRQVPLDAAGRNVAYETVYAENSYRPQRPRIFGEDDSAPEELRSASRSSATPTVRFKD